MKKTNWFWIKTFAYLVIASIALYLVLRIITATFSIDTNIDTGNSVFNWMYFADFALLAISGLGFAIAVFMKFLKKLF